MTDSNNTGAWQRKAMAFATRAHRHLWGKNNEDPLAFLFNQGLSNAFSKQLYLGWNKFGQDRPFETWGQNLPGTFRLPPGLVFPHIVSKELKGLFIISMSDPAEVFQVPGSSSPPLVLGDADAKERIPASGLLEGLCRFQAVAEGQAVEITRL